MVREAMAPKMRRPAASAPRARPRHRPAAEREEHLPVEKLYSWSDLTLERLGALDVIELDRASYYNASVKVAGRVRALHPGDGRMDFVLTGTQSESIMEAFGGGEDRLISVHLCKDSCGQLETGRKVFHARGFWDCSVAPKEWQMNLSEKAVAELDELSSLRRLAEERGKGRGGDKPPRPEVAAAEVVEGEKKIEGAKEKRKKKKKKERKGEKEWEEKLEAQEGLEVLEKGQKTARAVFAFTCLDPNVSRRKRLMRKARKMKKRSDKKRKRSSSSEEEASSSDSSSEEDGSEEEGPLFEETRKVKRLHERYPGALSLQAIENMREHLMSARGDLYSSSQEQLAPVFAIYAHQHLKGQASPVLWQEISTVAHVSDLILRRKIAAALDVLVQRAKALESTLKGGHYTVSRQLELGADPVAMTEAGESYEAARHAREDFRNKTVGPKPYGMGRKGDSEGKGRGKAVPSSEPAYKEKGEKGKKGKGKWDRKGKAENG